jgi:ketosteroid isomerase-like protein
MGAEDNARLLRRGYEAFSVGDIATLTELFPEDVVWHVPGKGGLSGDKRGRDAVFGYFGELVSRSGGTFKVTVHDVIGGEQHTIGLHHDDAERDGMVMNPQRRARRPRHRRPLQRGLGGPRGPSQQRRLLVLTSVASGPPTNDS